MTKFETNRSVLAFVLDVPESEFLSPTGLANDRTFWQSFSPSTWVFFTDTAHALTRYRPGETPIDFDIAAFIDEVR